jgi:hypothetical protein
MEGPYWEVYPCNEDCNRHTLDDVNGLMESIQQSLDEQVNKLLTTKGENEMNTVDNTDDYVSASHWGMFSLEEMNKPSPTSEELADLLSNND